MNFDQFYSNLIQKSKICRISHVMSFFEFRALIPKSTRGFVNGNNKNYDVLIIEVRTNQNEDAQFVLKLM